MSVILTKRFQEIIFEQKNNSTQLYLNATMTAKYFNKLPKDWLKTRETKAYLEAFSRQDFCPNDCELVIVKQGGNPNEQGTWIHKKLIIAFARWLSPEFAVWCDMTIEQILSEKLQKSQIVQPQTQTSQNFQLPEIGNSTQKMIELKNDVLETSSLIEILRNINPIDLFRLDQFYKEFHNFSPLETFKIDLENQFFLPTDRQLK